MTEGIYNRCRRKICNAFAYEIYTAATFNQSLQPTKNLHFSPATPTQGTYREKMESEIKKKKEKKELQNHNQSLFSSTMPIASFPRCIILDGNQM